LTNPLSRHLLCRPTATKNKKQNTNMKNKANAIVTSATAIANSLWERTQAVYTLADQIACLFEATSRDIAQAGEAVGFAWSQISGEIEGGLPSRLLVEACHQTSLTKEETRLFIKSTGLVSKQRAHVLTSAVFDDVSAREAKGGKGKKDKAVNPGLTVADVVKAIEGMTLSAKDAEAIVRAVQAQLA
jgi:hypothetical protein